MRKLTRSTTITTSFRAAAGVYHGVRNVSSLADGIVIISPVLTQGGSDAFNYRDLNFDDFVENTFSFWADMGWKVLVPTWRGLPPNTMPTKLAERPNFIFIDVQLVFEAFCEGSRGLHCLDWVDPNTAYTTGNLAKLASAGVALRLGLKPFLIDWDILCFRDPLPPMMTLLAESGVDFVTPSNPGKRLQQMHTFDAFSLLSPTQRTLKVFEDIRYSIARQRPEGGSFAAFDKIGTTMGLLSKAVEKHYRLNVRSQKQNVEPEFIGIAHVPNYILHATQQPEQVMLATNQYCLHKIGTRKSDSKSVTCMHVCTFFESD